MDYAKESLRLHYEWKGKLEMVNRADYILPKAFDPRVKDAVAKAVMQAARESGVARI